MIKGEAQAEIDALPVLQDLPQGVIRDVVGEDEWQQELVTSLGIAIVSGVLLVFAVLVLLYKRLMSPLVNMTSLALAPLGGILLVWLFGQPQSMPVYIGILLLLGIVFSAGTFGLNFQMTSALMATEVFDKGPTEYGLLGTFLAVGSLTGSLVAARRVRMRHRLVVGAALAFGAIEVVAGLAPSYVVFALLCPLLGLSALTMITSANTHLQLSTAPEMRGRVMALYMMIFIGGTPLGAPFIGWVGETFGARWTLVVGGVLTVLGTLLASVAFLGGRRVLTGLRAPGSLVPRVWDNQAVARARK